MGKVGVFQAWSTGPSRLFYGFIMVPTMYVCSHAVRVFLNNEKYIGYGMRM